ncbi:hypothetical protein WJ438_30485 [Streptomyces sp. GD-15H]|uniref:hypothetical protein n=1 Tax=Streptomyces sp. GD-15H TaxID=3129112 RepID=UPI0032475DD5
MKRGGASRPAVRALGPLLTAVPLLTVVLATGCGPSGAGHTGTPPPPSPSATSAEDVCVRLVAHWAHEVLNGTAYGDYQSMGLSNGQYDILREAVDVARPVREHQGAQTAHEMIDRQVREACAERHRAGGPAEGPWR